uniref:Piwi domain-containing protein n=1 Tax=Dendroctonus ponderosae TaxID=77166 RepID=A0AAR5QGN5_DENPD
MRPTGPTLDNARYFDHTVYYSGNDNLQHRNGVGIVVSPRIQPTLHATPFDVHVIQIYAPTADKDDAVIEEFYEQLERLIKMTNKQEITIIMGVCQAPQGISDSVKETKEGTVLHSSARIITYYS